MEHYQNFNKESIIQDEAVCIRMRQYIRGLKANGRTSETFYDVLNNKGLLLRELSFYAPDQVSLDTAWRWMRFLGSHAETHTKLTQMEELERRALKFEEDDMEKQILPQLEEGEHRAVCIFHDESYYSSNESDSVIWHGFKRVEKN